MSKNRRETSKMSKNDQNLENQEKTVKNIIKP